MRKKVAALLLTTFLTTSTFGTALASGGQDIRSTAGITPDSIIYKVDRYVEKIQLVFTGDAVKHAAILTQLAEERLAEAQVMSEEGKMELAQQAANEYTETVDIATESIQEMVDEANSED